jgi:rhamnulokinase
MPINTLYQLFAAQERTPVLLALSHHLLTIPDLFNYWLTGRTVCEWTNASTTQMADPRTGNWARPMLGRLGLPTHMLTEIVNPGTLVGTVLPSSAYHLAGTPVVAPASHDTGSAVAAFEARHDTAFLSSGTWSLLGIELDAPIINDLARALNFTNEAGVCGTTRFLKNVMGLWMVQGCRKSLASRGDSQPYDALVAAASEARPFETLLDPDDPRFLNPACMLTAIDSFCDDTSQPRPCNPAAYIRAVLESLALRYRVVMDDLERLTNLRIRNVRVVGGGSRNALLNQFTADATGRTAMTGPVEATALGNLAMQILATGVASSLRECREIVARTHESRVFEPSGSSVWDRQFERFQEYARGTHCLKH